MSKKQIKNLARDEDIQNEKDAEGSESEEEAQIAPSKRINKFALLEDEEEKKEDSDEKDQHHEAKTSQQPSSSKKTKKKNNKKKNKQQQKEGEEEDLKEFAKKLDSKISTVEKMAELLKISFTDLNADSELKKILGPGFRAPPTQKGKTGRKMAAFRIIPKKPEWPSAYDSGLSVVLDDGAPKIKGIKYYRFEHNNGYQEAQQMFWDIAQIPGAEFQAILESSRFHVDTLLILAEQVAQHDDARESRNLTEFAIYICESAFPNGFETLSAYTRLDYNWRENRAFFLLLFKHLKFLTKRRCFLIALNVAKLILLKDPSDPLGMHLLVDSLALKSGQYQFLLDYYEHFKLSHHIDSLPNMMYSIAFCHHFIALENDDPDFELIAQNLLFEAITSFPLILFDICEEMKIKPSPAVMKALQLDPMLVTIAPEGLRLLCKIYIYHNLEDIWKKEGFLNWIEGSIETIVTERPKEIANKISKLKEKYKKIYVGVPDAIARHGYLFDLYSCSTGIPAVDPFPPILGHHRSGYEKREQPTRQDMTEEGREGGGESDENAANRILNMIGQVIASLNPEYNNQNAAAANNDDVGGGGEAQAIPGLAAMMEQFGRIWPGERPNNPQVEAEGENENAEENQPQNRNDEEEPDE
uniref:Transcription factor 25 n=2 Tax=Panagrolaimus sp. PS1159 TaxID=55785 RepID=A0AC35GXK2_9BILA